MKTMMGMVCVLLLSGTTVLGEEKKKDPPPLGPAATYYTSIEVWRTVVIQYVGKEFKTSVRLEVTVKGTDLKHVRLIADQEKPAAILIQTRGGGHCYYVLPPADAGTFNDWGLSLQRQGQDKKSYIDDNGWSWRLKEGELPNCPHIVGRGTLIWKGGVKYSFQEEKSKRLWHRVFFVLQK